MSIQRWREAQQAERQHPCHSEVRPEADAKHIIERFNFDYRDLQDNEILVVGSGTGIAHSMSIGNVMAVDPLSQKLFDHSDQSSADIFAGAGEHLMFESDLFDTAINISVLDHTANPEATLSEIWRVLKPSGRLLFNLNIFSTPQIINKHLGKIDTPHPHHYNRDAILSLFSKAGFDIQFVNIWSPSLKKSSIKMKIAVKAFGMEKLDIVAKPNK